MAKKPASQPRAKTEIIRERAPDFVSLYANDTQIQSIAWDFRFIFGHVTKVPSEDDPTLVVTQIGEVRMSPEHAKRIGRAIADHVEKYEKRFGVIPQPKD